MPNTIVVLYNHWNEARRARDTLEKVAEYALLRRCRFVMIQDHERAKVLLRENRLAGGDVDLVLTPVAGLGDACTTRSTFLRERLGIAPRLEPGGVWVHAASVGEIRAASRLVDRLEAREHRVCTSTQTFTGREAMRRWRPDVPCHLAPLDHPWCVGSALERVDPRALVLVEAELWPSWIAAARRRAVPVLLISARVSDRSFARYRRLERLVAPTLSRLAALGARTELDAERFLALGASPERVSVTGDLKLDAEEKPLEVAPELDRVLGRAPLVVAGSTHAGEEEAALDALDTLERTGLACVLALAPRHPERVEEVLRLLRRRRRPWRRRTRLGELPLDRGEISRPYCPASPIAGSTP